VNTLNWETDEFIGLLCSTCIDYKIIPMRKRD
jgi:hypothetical protein